MGAGSFTSTSFQLKDAASAAVPADQLQALSYVSLRLQSVGYDVSLTFFGFVLAERLVG